MVGNNRFGTIYWRASPLSGGWTGISGALSQVSIGGYQTYVGVSPGQQFFKYTPTNPWWVYEDI